MKIVRDSKFRHVFGETGKERYDDIRPTSKATEAPGLRVNEKFVAIGWEAGGGGTIAVIPTSRTGRQKADTALITGHRGPILDFEFNPFDDNMLLSCSEDLTIKLWQIPDEGLKEHLKEPLATLEGHGKKVSFCTWNKCASNILASTAFDLTTRVWNVEEQAEAYKIEMPEQVWCLKWNYTGSLLAATSKDKKMRVIDPRSSKFAAECETHPGSKSSKVEWMGSSSDTDQNYKILTTGFSPQAERQIGLWDLRKLESGAPLNMLVLDQGTGALYPTYDPGTKMAFFAAKGDSNIRYFEMVDADPYLHFISATADKNPMKAFDFVPKRCVDTSTHTVMKGLKLEANSILQISFKVPRKSEAFQEDLFPDCPSTEPAQTADQWTSGAECKGPKLQSMTPGAAGADTGKRASTASVGIVSMKDVKAELAVAKARITELELENANLKEQLAAK